ncbi:O-antigen ligase family protein [Shewanella sp. 10N.286.54.B9]|uniref:O-antigen ligase family protein n=1 Tax=Shewanella sp. 10N.286.54.B9 TaxID=3229719 RepID=UPI0035519379
MSLKTYSWAVLILFVICFMLSTVFSYNLIGVLEIGSEYDLKRVIAVGFIGIFSLGLLVVRDVHLPVVSRATQFVTAGFICLAAYSALVSKHPYWGLVEIASIVLLIVAFYLLSACMRVVEQDKLLGLIYGFSLLFSLLTFYKYILFLLFSYLDAQSFNIHGLLLGYVNVRFFNQLQVMLLPLLFLPFVLPLLARFKKISIALIALHWLALLQTEARGAILSLVLALAVIALFSPKEIRNRIIVASLKSMLLGIILWFVLIFLIPTWLMDTTSFEIRTTSSGRIDLWLYVLHAIPERPWTGFGPMSFSWAENKPLASAHPHNSVMQQLYEYGVIACVVLTAWVMYWIYQFLATLKNSANSQSVPIIYATVAALIYSLFSGVVVMPMAQLLLVVMLALSVQTLSFQHYKLTLLHRLQLCILTIVVTYMVLGTYQSEELKAAFMPRIWFNGLISY